MLLPQQAMLAQRLLERLRLNNKKKDIPNVGVSFFFIIYYYLNHLKTRYFNAEMKDD